MKAAEHTMHKRILDRLELSPARRSQLPPSRSWSSCVRDCNRMLAPDRRIVGHMVDAITPRGLHYQEVEYQIAYV